MLRFHDSETIFLEDLQTRLPRIPLHYWRNKQGREIDFVFPRNRDAVKCKPFGLDPVRKA